MNPPGLQMHQLNIETASDLKQIAIYYCQFPRDIEEQEVFVRQHQEILSEALRNASLGRKTEFIAGRLLANRGLKEVGIDHYHVSQNADRSPCWPPGISGSISHKDQFAVAAVAPDMDFLGLDLESVLTEQRAKKLERRIINDAEKEVIAFSGLAYGNGFTRVFSAKESLYKAIYPYVKRYLPFSICEVTGIHSSGLTLRLNKEISELIQYDKPFDIHTFTLHNKVLTLLATDSINLRSKTANRNA